MLSIVHMPSSAVEAADLLRGGGWIVGGGTVVMPRVNTGAVPVDQLVSLSRAGLSGIHVDGDSRVATGELASPERQTRATGTLDSRDRNVGLAGPERWTREGGVSVGAATTLAAVGADERLRFLRPVVSSIASPPVRNLATVGGNLFVGQPYGDLAVALLALDARVDVVGAGGTREVSVDEVGTDPAEVATAVHFGLPAEGTWFYRKAMRRRYNSASIVTVAAVVAVGDGVVQSARIALGGVAARPVRAAAAERALVGEPFGRAAVEAAAEAAREGIEPADDAYASAWYRTRVLPVHVRRALLGEE